MSQQPKCEKQIFSFPNLPFHYNQYIFESPIGSGGFGSIYKVLNTNYSNMVFAAKIIPLSKKPHFEMKTLMSLSHQSILKIYDYFEFENEYLIMILEYCDSGSLADLIYKPTTDYYMPLNVFIAFAMQIVDGLYYMHINNHIAHLDIKPQNLLLSHSDRIKIADFGLSRCVIDRKLKNFFELDDDENNDEQQIQEKQNILNNIANKLLPQTDEEDENLPKGVSFKYAPPEAFKSKKLNSDANPNNSNNSNIRLFQMMPNNRNAANEVDDQSLVPKDNLLMKSDIWSLGVTFFEMITGTSPWDGKTREAIKVQIINREVCFDMIKDLKLRSLLYKMLNVDPEIRPNIIQVKSMLEKIKSIPKSTNIKLASIAPSTQASNSHAMISESRLDFISKTHVNLIKKNTNSDMKNNESNSNNNNTNNNNNNNNNNNEVCNKGCIDNGLVPLNTYRSFQPQNQPKFKLIKKNGSMNTNVAANWKAPLTFTKVMTGRTSMAKEVQIAMASERRNQK